ncbi:MAG: C13 family peptidase [Burkholderiales bacterium]
MIGKRQFLIAAVVLAASLFTAGCAINPLEGEGKRTDAALLQKQFDTADQRRQDHAKGRLIYAGFAMHSQSRAFRNDVLAGEKVARAIDPDAIVFKLNNPATLQRADWPHATGDNVAAVLKKTAALARPQDRVMILFATHGGPNVLANQIGTSTQSLLNAKRLGELLADLRGKPALLVLSACFSGSFLTAAAEPNRVLLTAAARDRNSFGCHFQSSNTYFVNALLNQPGLLDHSVVEAMEKAIVTIDQKEKREGLSPPSLPQMSVGSEASAWANRPLGQWLQPY